MPQAALLNLQGEEQGQVELDAQLFDVDPNYDLMHQALLYVDSQRAQRRGMTLGRSEIARTGAKFGRQKGLGRARHGARSSPTFVGGSKAHGPKGLRAKLRMPQKMRRRALACGLTAQFRKGLMRFVEDLRPAEISTAQMAEALINLRCSRGKVLAVVGTTEYYDETLQKSSRNLPRFLMRLAPHFNVRDVLNADHIVMTQAGLAEMRPGGDVDAND